MTVLWEALPSRDWNTCRYPHPNIRQRSAILPKRWGKDWRPRNRWEPHRKTSRVNKPRPPGSSQSLSHQLKHIYRLDKCLYPTPYVPLKLTGSVSSWLPRLASVEEDEPNLSETWCKGIRGETQGGRDGEQCLGCKLIIQKYPFRISQTSCLSISE